MADEVKKYLDYDGLKHLVEKLTNKIEASGGGSGGGDYLPLSGGTIDGDLTVNATYGGGGVTINAPKENTGAEVLTVNGQTRFKDEISVDACATIASDLDLRGCLFCKKSEAYFCGGTYIDTSGHIHLPSGVEIY